MLRVHLSQMILQIVLSRQTFTTNLTLEHEVLVVHAHVTSQQELGAEPLSTDAAGEWLLCTVGVPVPQHVTLVGELLVADVTRELGFLVLLHVHFEVGVFGKHFVALRAGEGLSPLATMLRTDNGSPHRICTQFTVLTRDSVYGLVVFLNNVFVKPGLQPERVGTQVAFER